MTPRRRRFICADAQTGMECITASEPVSLGLCINSATDGECCCIAFAYSHCTELPDECTHPLVDTVQQPIYFHEG